MQTILEENYLKLKGKLIGIDKQKLEESKELSLIDDINQTYIVRNKNELVATIKKDNNIEKINPKQVQTLILFGISGIKYIEEKLLYMPLESQILIIEPNIELLQLELQHYDFDKLAQRDITIYCDHLDGLTVFLNNYLSNIRLCKIGNLITHINDVYLNESLTSNWISAIKKIIRSKIYSIGNSIDDSLIGFKQNMENIKYLSDSKSVASVKNMFAGVPAIIVSAGPSINKNIQLLKEVQNRYVVIAVDTIVPRLLKEGITPHFICSVERVEEVYSYFYKDKNYSKEITLVGPPLLKSEILKEFNGEKILPMRRGVGEYIWLSKVLNLVEDDFTFMGISCAHMAFGIGVHLGCNPIILMGQDLAFAEDGKSTHAKGTIYDNKKLQTNEEQIFETEGYYGGLVKTTEIWIAFKQWFEEYIHELNIEVINATEGGAKILYTHQYPLEEVIKKYSGKQTDVYKMIKEMPNYKLDIIQVTKCLREQSEYILKMTKQAEGQISKLKGLKVHRKNGGNLEKIRKKLSITDSLLNEVVTHPLLMHIYQSHIIVHLWKYYKVDLEITEDTIKKNIQIQKELLEPIVWGNNKLLEYINQAINELDRNTQQNG